ncbi:UbiD family decarboxylase, partial [Streptomyces pathocidini]|uniref:UbiD family decarboxylase n=1 Tax=Streptomyces pathocidini TaxID=1650571 RepID=UPI0006E1C518
MKVAADGAADDVARVAADGTAGAARDLPGLSLRAALSAVREQAPLTCHIHHEPMDRVALAAHYADHYAGVPATSAARPEDIALYTNITDVPDPHTTDAPGSHVTDVPGPHLTNVPDPSMPVLLGTYGDAERIRGWLPGLPRRADHASVAALLSATHSPERLADSPFPHVSRGDEVDLRQLPALLTTPRDAGPYVTTGLLHAHDPATGRTALAVHRLLVRDRNQLVIWMLPSRRLLALYEDAVARGERLPVSVNIGAPPAAMIASAVASAFLPEGTGKLELAGAFAGGPVALTPAVSQPAWVLAESEVVLEGYFDGTTADEALPGRARAGSLPEVLGYDGEGATDLPAITVTAVATRESPVFQAVIGPGREQSLILGLAGAVSFALSGVGGELVTDVHYAPAGGGMFLLVAQVRKRSAADDARLAALAEEVFRRHRFVKVLILVDEDVDPSSAED